MVNKEAQLKLSQLKENINKVIVGKEDIIDKLLTALLANGHVLLEDVPGMGKTVLAKSLAKSFAAQFKRIQFTPDVLPSDVTGINIYNPKNQDFELRLGPIHANIVLADEINRATPRTQSSLLEAMEERQATIDGQSYKVPAPFFVIATQNPVEQQGTFPLPEAQMDRFIMQLALGYPSFQDEQIIMQRFRSEQPLETLEAVLKPEELQAMQEEIKDVHVHPEIEEYILKLVHATRDHQQIEVGVSPRGTLALMRAAQAKAYIEQREYVIPDDIKSLFINVCAHRIMLTLDAQLHVSEAKVLTEIMNEIHVPLEEVGQA